MRVVSIKESGSNNLLRWAISKSTSFYKDESLCNMINNELYYIVELENINFFELFRLTQLHRNYLRILDEKQAECPSTEELSLYFPGMYRSEESNDEVNKSSLAEFAINSFINLALQMNSDDDIINFKAMRLFLPMISRKFNVQIPVPFYKLLDNIKPEDIGKIFNQNYPNTLMNIDREELDKFRMTISLEFSRSTSIIKHDNRYDKYVNYIKYSPLKTFKTGRSDMLYKYALLGFYKYDKVSREIVRCQLFNPNNSDMLITLKRLNMISTPLYIEFVIQLPIQYMQVLENTYGEDKLSISYESSMSEIINTGITYDDFYTIETDETINPENRSYQTSEDIDFVEKRNNAISEYRIRITEANQSLLNAIQIMISSDDDADVTQAFSMLPSVYNTKAVIRLNLQYADEYVNDSDPVISDMFKDLLNTANVIIADINSSKQK